MNFFETLERISQLHYLIKLKRTGNPEYLANKLGVSRSTLYNMIDEMKSYDAPIAYSRTSESYFYTKPFDMELQCSLQFIKDERELKKIIGGCKIFASVHYFGRKDVTFTFNGTDSCLIESNY